MDDRKNLNTKLLFILILLIALGLRTIKLGEAALGDTELHWALQALDVSRGEQIQIDGNPLYVFLTGLIFNIFGSSEIAARIMPALLGSVLVLTPYFFRKHLGSRAVLLIGLGLAIDPGLVSLSRQAGSDMSAFGFLALALVFLFLENDIWAGVFLAFALLSGSSIIFGLIVMGAAFILTSITKKNEKNQIDLDLLKKLVPPLIVTLLIAGTWFSKYPSGMSAFGNGFNYLIEKFATSSDLPSGSLLFSIIVFQPMMLTFGLIGVFSGRITERIASYLKWWFVVALVFVLVLPGREAADMVWLIIPLYVLAGLTLQRFVFRKSSFGNWVELLLMTIILVFGLFGYFNIVNVVISPPPVAANELIDSLMQFNFGDWGLYDEATHNYIVRWIMMPTIPVIIAMMTFIFSSIWTKTQSIKGLGLGVFVFLSAFSLSLSWRVCISSSSVERIWQADHSISEQANLKEWIEWFGTINKGDKNELEIVIDEYSDQIAWQVRNFTAVSYGSGSAEKILPEIAITSEEDLNLAEIGNYSMQRIQVSKKTIRNEEIYGSTLRWFIWDEDQISIETINFWVRHDLFPTE